MTNSAIKELGKRLAGLLDEEDWKCIEPFLVDVEREYFTTLPVKLAAVMQPYTPDAIHRASFEQLLEILTEMLYEMSQNEGDGAFG